MMTPYVKLFLVYLWMLLVGSRGILRELKEKTVLIKKGEISTKDCEVIRDKIDEILDGDGNGRIWRDERKSDERILGFEKDIGDLNETLKIEHWIKCIDQYTGTKTRSWFLMANRVTHREDNLGSGGGMHRDSAYSHQVKCIWYLSDVKTENGPFCYVEKTNATIFKARKKYPVGRTRFEEVDDTLTEVLSMAGSLVIADTRCVHGGKPIAKGRRYAVTLYTSPDKNDKERRVVKIDGLV